MECEGDCAGQRSEENEQVCREHVCSEIAREVSRNGLGCQTEEQF